MRHASRGEGRAVGLLPQDELQASPDHFARANGVAPHRRPCPQRGAADDVFVLFLCTGGPPGTVLLLQFDQSLQAALEGGKDFVSRHLASRRVCECQNEDRRDQNDRETPRTREHLSVLPCGCRD